MISYLKNKIKLNTFNWTKFSLEFLSIFIAVVSAFALNNWNEHRKDAESEQKILREIKNGIELDLKDFQGNIYGHSMSLRANTLMKQIIENKNVNLDSFPLFYLVLFRDYAPVINQSGYESLKSSGMKTIKNDSLRFEIIALYDYYYSIINKLDNEIDEMKSFVNYYARINDVIHPYMTFNSDGNLYSIKLPLDLPEIKKKELLSYLWRLETNRKYKIARYNLIIEKMNSLKAKIENQL
jgi:hypothetical protein